MIFCISPGKSLPFSRCREQLQLTCLGRLLNTIPSDESVLDFSGSLSSSLSKLSPGTGHREVSGSGKRVTISLGAGEVWWERRVGLGCDSQSFQRKDLAVVYFKSDLGLLTFGRDGPGNAVVSSKADTSISASFNLWIEGGSWCWLNGNWAASDLFPWWARGQAPEAQRAGE